MMPLEFINRETGVEPELPPDFSYSGVIDCMYKVRIGLNTFSGHNVAILTGGHDPTRFGLERKGSTAGGPVTIEEGVWIGSFAIILGPCHIGKNAVIGAGAVVTHDIPAYALAAGVPARVVKYYEHL